MAYSGGRAPLQQPPSCAAAASRWAASRSGRAVTMLHLHPGLGGRGGQCLPLFQSQPLQVGDHGLDDALVQSCVRQPRQDPGREGGALRQRLLLGRAAQLLPVTLVQDPIPFALRFEAAATAAIWCCALPRDFLAQFGARAFSLLLPIGQPVLVLLLQRLRLFLDGLRVGHFLLDAGAPTRDDVEDRVVEEVLQDPDEDQEVDDFERKVVQSSSTAGSRSYLTRYSSSGLRNRMISTITST